MINQEYNFKHPILYNKEVSNLENDLVEDLELIKYNVKNNDENENGILEYILKPDSPFGKETINLWSKNITTNKKYLKETYKLIKNFPNLKKNIENHNKIIKIWKDIQEDDNFLNKYKYIEYSHFKYLNNNTPFLQLLSTYNIASPIVFLIIPFIMLIIPFFILKFKKLQISFGTYFSLLKKVLKNHAFGAILNTNFKQIELGGIIYLIFTVGIYLFQVYQQIISCINFHKNMKKVHDYFLCVAEFLKETNTNIEILIPLFQKNTTYDIFNQNLLSFNKNLKEYIQQIEFITPYEINIKTFTQMGLILKHFYNLHNNDKIKSFIKFSFSFNGYIDNLYSWNKLYKDKKINACNFNDYTSIKDGYYPKLLNNFPITNSYNLEKNIIITGPNAAGKTTLIKGTVLNIIFSQQIGCGFYKSASLNPYKYIHCYLNIPDTSGRDSLFQAEAKRCKEILDKFDENKGRHFCIFDELYSGTNPFEAVASAYGFLNYISKKNNIEFMITTHYFQLCNLLKENEKIINKNMKILMKNNNLEYTYKIEDGISSIKGGFKVIKDLEYPNEIINDITNISKKII